MFTNSWVKTQMGQDFADAAQYGGEIPTDVPTSAKGIIERVCPAGIIACRFRDTNKQTNRSMP